MELFKEFATQVKQLAKLISGTPSQTIPDTKLASWTNAVSSICSELDSYLPPTAAEKKRAKAHPVAAQIIAYTSNDFQRKRFFDKGYFRNKFEGLPPTRHLVAPADLETASVAAIRDALILHYYRQGEGDRQTNGLELLRRELETDFKANPATTATENAKEIFRSLMKEEEVPSVAALLKDKFPDVRVLNEFARAIRVTIPAQSKRKGAPKESVHERLARAIHSQGAVTRMRFD
ncbi:MAG: hypothetical protein AB1646_07575 [Thermodesulfobacteriota bacterium]